MSPRSDDPFYWYFSAALAIREGDHSRATMAIGKALTMAPSDPTILFEAGHVAEIGRSLLLVLLGGIGDPRGRPFKGADGDRQGADDGALGSDDPVRSRPCRRDRTIPSTGTSRRHWRSARATIQGRRWRSARR